MKHEIYSHSRLASFEDCPRKFQYRYVLKIPSETESVEAFVGKRVHEVLERLYIFTGRGKVPPLAQRAQRYSQLFDEPTTRSACGSCAARTASHYRELGERCLTNYYRAPTPSTRTRPWAGGAGRFRSTRLGGYRHPGHRRPHRPRARRRHRDPRLQDRRTRPQPEQLDQDRQLALYQIGVAQRSARGNRCGWCGTTCATASSAPPPARPSSSTTLRDQTIELIDRIQAETPFEPRPSPLCRWCEYREICPASPARRARAPEPPPPGQPETG